MDIVTTHLCRRLNFSLVSFTTPFAISSEQESLNNTQITLHHQKLLQEDERQYDTDYVNLCQDHCLYKPRTPLPSLQEWEKVICDVGSLLHLNVQCM